MPTSETQGDEPKSVVQIGGSVKTVVNLGQANGSVFIGGKTPEQLRAQRALRLKICRVVGAIGSLALLGCLIDVVVAPPRIPEASFYAVVGVIFGVTALARTAAGGSRLVRVAYGVLLALLAVAAAYGMYFERHLRKTTTPARPAQPSRTLSLPDDGRPMELARRPSLAGELAIEDIYVDETLCSFTETRQYMKALGPNPTPLNPIVSPTEPVYRTFMFDHALLDAFRSGGCVGPEGDRPVREVLPALRANLQRKGEAALLDYIGTPGELQRIIRNRPDIFKQVTPSPEDLFYMKRAVPEQYASVRKWLLKCIGIYQPVLTLVVRNKGKAPLVLSRVDYDVAAVGQVLGGASGPLYPGITYTHRLEHRKGIQSFPLEPPFRIEAGDHASFNLRLVPTKFEPGLVWYMSIVLNATTGQRARTSKFQLIMSK